MIPSSFFPGLTLTTPSIEHRGPNTHSNWVLVGRVMAGAYPGNQDPVVAKAQVYKLLQAGITTFVCLQEEEELKRFDSYFGHVESFKQEFPSFSKPVSFKQFPIPDMGVPKSNSMLKEIEELVLLLNNGENLYIHCWGGHGRTGLVVGCLLGRLFPLTSTHALELTSGYHQQREDTRGNVSPQHLCQFRQVKKIVDFFRESLNSNGVWKQNEDQTAKVNKDDTDKVNKKEEEEPQSNLTLDSLFSGK